MIEPLGRRYRIEPLTGTHDRAGFACGVAALDRYFAIQVGQDARKGYAAVFVAVDISTGRVAAFYTLSMAGAAVDLLPESVRRKMPRYPSVPCVRLGRLAVAGDYKGQGLGKWLLVNALGRSLESEIAWAAFLVDAKDDGARSFYRQFGFLELVDDPMHLFLPRRTVEEALTPRLDAIPPSPLY